MIFFWFEKLFFRLMNYRKNSYHPLVMIHGDPKIGKNVCIGAFSEIYAKGAKVEIGDGCDIASFVAINCADSHNRCLGFSKNIIKKDIILEDHVFVGSHSMIKGGVHVGHHSVIGAGTVVDAAHIPPYSLIVGNPMKIKSDYYFGMITNPIN